MLCAAEKQKTSSASIKNEIPDLRPECQFDELLAD